MFQSATDQRLAEAKRLIYEASGYFSEAYDEYIMCVWRRPWNPRKVAELLGRAIPLYEKALRIYEDIGMGSSIDAQLARNRLDFIKAIYRNAREGKC